MKKKLPVIFILIAAIFNSEMTCAAALLDRVVATVNNEVITWSELMNVIAVEGKEYLGEATGKERDEKIKEIERSFLDNLIESKLQIQEARKMGLDVSNSEIDGAVDEIKEKYGLTGESLVTSLKAEGMTLRDYRERLSEQILLQKVINYAVRNNIVIADKEIEEYYQANRDKYHEKERIRIRQIFFAGPEDESQKADIEAVAKELTGRIDKGEEFSKLASEFSEDPSKQFGGDLGYISRGSALKEVEDIAFTLKTGEVSSPFWSPAGLHIIKVEDKIEGGGIGKVRDMIKGNLFQKAFQAGYYNWKSGLREKAYIRIKL